MTSNSKVVPDPLSSAHCEWPPVLVQAVLTAHAQVVIMGTEHNGFAFVVVDVPDDIVAVAKCSDIETDNVTF